MSCRWLVGDLKGSWRWLALDGNDVNIYISTINVNTVELHIRHIGNTTQPHYNHWLFGFGQQNSCSTPSIDSIAGTWQINSICERHCQALNSVSCHDVINNSSLLCARLFNFASYLSKRRQSFSKSYWRTPEKASKQACGVSFTPESHSSDAIEPPKISSKTGNQELERKSMAMVPY